MASPFRKMDERREDTRIGVSWAVGGVFGPVSGGSGSIIQSPRISRIIRNKTTFRVRSAAGRGRRGCLFGGVEYQLVTITLRAEPPQNSGVGATAF